MTTKLTDTTQVTKEYYDSKDADEFYYNIWGGEDIHIGIYELPDESIFQASKRTIQRIVSMLKSIDADTNILDIGSGYGGAARYLAARFRCHVTCLNLSEKENERNRVKNKEVRLDDLVDVHGGNFENLPFDDESFDVVWSQDAILHSGNKAQVFAEVKRVLKPGGHFIFTDPMQDDNCPEAVLQPILDRIHLNELGSVQRYKQLADDNGLKTIEIVQMPQQLAKHYHRVSQELTNRRDAILEVCSEEYVDRMQAGLLHWINGGQKGHLNWGILHFQKPNA